MIEGDEEFHMRPPIKSSRQAERQAQVKKQTDLSDKDQSLLIQLKALRSELARALGKPAFVVFSDATLMDMVAKRPTHRQSMLDVSGVGETKFARFGEAFLEVISNS